MLWPELPYIDRVGLVFLLCMTIAVVISMLQSKEEKPGSVDLGDVDFTTTRSFNIAGILRD